MAIKYLNTAKELDPNYHFAYNFLGRAYDQQGKMAEAIVAFRRDCGVGKRELCKIIER
jgi:predicted Zn-dependent protease